MKGWPMISLGRLITIEYGSSMPDRLRASNGTVPVFGSNGIIGKHNQSIACAPAIIIGRKGSIGAVNYSSEPSWPIDTAYFIDEFPKTVLPRWLFHFLCTLPLSHIKQDGPKAGIRRKDLYAIQIPVPSLPEQQRFIEYIESFSSRAQELRDLNAALVQDSMRLLRSEYTRIVQDVPMRSFGEVAKLIRRRVVTTPDGLYPELGIRSFGKGTFHKPSLSGKQLGNKRVFLIKTGDLVFMNVFAWEGAIALAKPEDDGRVGSHRFMAYEVDAAQATAEFLCYHYLTESGMERIRSASPGSAGRNRTLGITKLQAIRVPVPPIESQRRFSKLYAICSRLQEIQSTIDADLAAFAPAVLAKAFRGGLRGAEKPRKQL